MVMEHKNFLTREFNLRDTPAIIRLGQAAQRDGHTSAFADHQSLRATLADQHTRLLVAVLPDQHVIGYAAVAKEKADQVAIREIYVDPSRRGFGVGRALVSHAAEAAQRAQMPNLSMSFQAENTSARRFYKALGFDTQIARAVLPVQGPVMAAAL